MDLQRKPKRSLPIVSFVSETRSTWLISGYTDPNYALSSPSPKPTTHQQVSAHTFNLIIGTLATIWNLPPEHNLGDLVTLEKISVYGRVRVLGGGDSIRVARLNGADADRRDASFISVSISSMRVN